MSNDNSPSAETGSLPPFSTVTRMGISPVRSAKAESLGALPKLEWSRTKSMSVSTAPRSDHNDARLRQVLGSRSVGLNVHAFLPRSRNVRRYIFKRISAVNIRFRNTRHCVPSAMVSRESGRASAAIRTPGNGEPPAVAQHTLDRPALLRRYALEEEDEKKKVPATVRRFYRQPLRFSLW
jgi:hypothetical protein